MKVFDRARWTRASPYLDRVLDLPAAERAACLHGLRATDPDIASDVEALLEQHRELSAEGFLDAGPRVAPPEPALTGVTVGAYRLVSPMGHGGMGTVWLAERSDGRFEGQAALKLLNAALIGRAGEERFKREGTILARLTHPHIARLIDAGVSPTGQPYLVLERIDGRHIDRYCDEERLGIEDRLRLFLDVQAAVAHAHANLIIHRDLKPSNVLVTADGQVKLLDFGIAKLLADDSASDATLMLTRDGEVALTPKYAAPEQVTGGRITTATDVYALGVLLFELLSGRHPTATTAQTAAEFVKAVADTDPMRLSSAATDPASDTAGIAAARATTPERLRRALSGDLEIIVAKALKTDPAERYGSVAEFADDLRRLLDSQPIAARPDSFGYRGAKFVRRHRRALALGSLATASVIAVIGFYTIRLSAERDRARVQALKASRVSELLIGLMTGADPYRNPVNNELSVKNLLDAGAQRVTEQLADEPDLQAQLLTVIGRTHERMGNFDKARPVLERALAIGRAALGEDSLVLAQTLNDLGVLRRQLGDSHAAEPLLRESLTLRRRLLGQNSPDVAVTLVELNRVLQDQGRAAEAEPLAREALEIRTRVFGDEHRETATSKSDLGMLLLRRGDLAGAESLLRQNVKTTEHVLGINHPNSATAKSNLAQLLLAKGEASAAEQLMRQSVAVFRTIFGADRPEYAQKVNGLAAVTEAQGRLVETEQLLEECVRIASRHLPADHPMALLYAVNLARVHLALGKADGVEAVLRHALDVRQRRYPSGDWRVAQVKSLLGAALLARHRYRDAEPLMLEADEALRPIPGVEGNEREANRRRLTDLYSAVHGGERGKGFR